VVVDSSKLVADYSCWDWELTGMGVLDISDNKWDVVRRRWPGCGCCGWCSYRHRTKQPGLIGHIQATFAEQHPTYYR
jgi:hypothetical protein